MKTIYIDATELRAVRVFAGKQDIRFYLNGVLVQATARETRIVATDGSILGVFDREQQNEGVIFDEFIIPNDVIDALKPNAIAPVRVTIENDRYQIQQFDDRALSFKPIDGRFPDYCRAIPEKVSGEAAQFNGEWLAKADKAQKLISKGASAHIWPDGPTGSALFGLYGAHRFVGVIAPRRFTEKIKALSEPDTSAFRTALRATGDSIKGAVADTADELL